MDKADRGNLDVLLNHWVEHNKEHGEEYKEWTEKTKSLEESEVHDNIMEAVQQLDKVNESLLKALNKLRG